MPADLRADEGAPGAGVALRRDLQSVIEPQLARLAAGSGCRTLSDWSFANLYLFRAAHDCRYVQGSWPHITGITYDGMPYVFPLFALEDAPQSVLHGLLRGGRCIFPLSDDQLARLDPHEFVATHSPDDSDYLYPASNFAHYRGKVLQKKGNLARQFLAAHRLEVQPCTPALLPQVEVVLSGWLRDKGKSLGDADDLPCREALALAPELGLEALLFLADGKPAGVLIGQPLQPDVDVIRFAKSLARYKGLAQAMFQHYAVRRGPAVAWLNFEQDLGLANFRATKRSYRPQALLAKHRVTLRGTGARPGA